jgi:aryl-alcohol dehydrogenase-like predicted oxidoreductase
VAAGDSRVGALQLSLNLCDRDGAAIAADAAARGVGVIVKRSLLGLPWRRSEPPADPPHAEYFRRFQRFAAEYGGADWQDLALRFAAFADGVACCIVGGVNLAHVSSNVESIARGPLAADTRAALANAYCAADDGWHGIV